ncbi:uncharacterized protein lrrc52 isoform X1 [Festucalex cinctus]
MRVPRQPGAHSLRLLSLLVFVMGAAPSPALTAGCPDRCVCDDQLVVQCAGRELTRFPADLPLATRQLIISNNRIGDLPALQLNYLSDLVYLDCSNNSLTEISESTFGNLRKLAYLDLSFNALLQIDERTFGPLPSLVMLRLTDNPGLGEIHADAFAENVALQVSGTRRQSVEVRLRHGGPLPLGTDRELQVPRRGPNGVPQPGRAGGSAAGRGGLAAAGGLPPGPGLLGLPLLRGHRLRHLLGGHGVGVGDGRAHGAVRALQQTQERGAGQRRRGRQGGQAGKRRPRQAWHAGLMPLMTPRPKTPSADFGCVWNHLLATI